METTFKALKFRVLEEVGATAFFDRYEIVDSESGKSLATAVEEADFSTKIQKLFFSKPMLPLKLKVRDPMGNLVIEIFKPRSLWRSKFIIRNGSGEVIAKVKESIFSLGPRLKVSDSDGNRIGTVSGGWKYRHFSFFDSNNSVAAVIDHIYGGFSKELLTTADDYQVEITREPQHAPLVLGLALCIDIAFHE